MCSEIINWAVTGLCGGIFAGIGIWGIDRLREMRTFSRDEKRIIKFLKENSSGEFRTTHRIASDVNLTEGRVNYVCSYSEKIKRNEKQRETWRLREEPEQ